MSRNFIQLFLTCANEEEADKISSILLEQKFIACAKAMPIKSTFNWENKLNHDDEILLIMDSAADLFEEIDSQIDKIHSYDVYNLQAIVTSHISKSTADWLSENLRNG